MNGDKRLSILFLVSDACASGTSESVRALAAHLEPGLFQVTIAVLGKSPTAAKRDPGEARIRVESIPIRGALDLAGARRLRRVVEETRPHLVHACGPRAARLARLFVTFNREYGNLPRLVVSSASEPGGGLAGWLARRPICRADRVVPCTRTDGDRYRRLGVPAEQLTLIAPAAPAAAQGRAQDLRRELDIPDNAGIIVAGGRSAAGAGPKDAIIVFDMVRYEAKSAHLVIVGAGAETAALDRFGRSLGFEDYRVRFAPDGVDRLAAIACSHLVVAANPREAVADALAAMAAGKPVVGWSAPDVTEIVEDKVTGLLVPPGDRVALASAARTILDNPAYGRRLGEAGRARAAEHFGLPRMVEQFSRLYRELVPAPRVCVQT